MERNTFDGFRSRCTIHRRCSASSAESTAIAVAIASAGGSGPVFQAVRQRLSLEQLHREKRLAVVLADLEELADVRVAHGRGGPRLAHQTIPHLRIRRREDAP